MTHSFVVSAVSSAGFYPLEADDDVLYRFYAGELIPSDPGVKCDKPEVEVCVIGLRLRIMRLAVVLRGKGVSEGLVLDLHQNLMQVVSSSVAEASNVISQRSRFVLLIFAHGRRVCSFFFEREGCRWRTCFGSSPGFYCRPGNLPLI